MHRRVGPAAIGLLALVATACAPGGAAELTSESAEEDVPALLGIERDTSNGARRVDTTIDPGELEPPPPPLPTIGNLTIPCGPSVAAFPPPEIPALSAVPGVTTTSVTIGTGNDRGGLYSSGSGRGIPDAIRVLADRCNALGGIDGREVIVVEYDAAVIEVADRVTEACASVFALVGQGYLLDAVSEPVRLECGLPSFPAWTTTFSSPDALTVAALPTQPDTVILDGLFMAAFAAAEAADQLGIVVPATPGGADTVGRIATAIEGSGLEIAATAFEYPLDREPDWPAIVADARSAGIGILWVSGSCQSTLVPLMGAAGELGWRPALLGGPDLYDPYCAAESAELLDGMIAQLPLYPAEDRGVVDAVDEHVQLFRAAGVPPTADALRAASAFWLWATAVGRCEESPTRGCVVEKAAAIGQWTAGGLHPATDPGAATNSGCVVLVSVIAGAFERLAPVTPGRMNCEPGVVVPVVSPTGLQ